MDYKTYKPEPPVSDFVKLFWSLEAPPSSQPKSQTIVPDGCIEMIFHFGDLYRQLSKRGTWITQPRSFVFGQVTQKLEIAPTGATGVVAARFLPNGFAPFTDMEIDKIENRAVPIIDLFGAEGAQLEANVLSALSNEAKVSTLQHFLAQRLNSQEVVDNISKASVQILFKLKGQVSVSGLASQLGTSTRQLERKLSSTIGLSPKQLSKIVRLQSTLKMLEQNRIISLTALACENGYYDQAHFIKDFNEFTGMSPSHFFSDNLRLSALFIGID